LSSEAGLLGSCSAEAQCAFDVSAEKQDSCGLRGKPNRKCHDAADREKYHWDQLAFGFHLSFFYTVDAEVGYWHN